MDCRAWYVRVSLGRMKFWEYKELMSGMWNRESIIHMIYYK
jgi:hypothetical protein